jgi:MFS family permease
MSSDSSETTDHPTPRSVLKIAVQLIGFAAGLALLGWCAREALKPGNREQLARLGEAAPGPVLLLFACSLATLALNGLIFWVTLLPEKRLRVSDTLATNAFATMLAYMPFKISVVARVALHNRRDGVALMTIAAWFGAIGAMVIVALGPVSVVSLWRQGVDTLWWVGSGAGVVASLALLLIVAGVLAGERGLGRLHRVLDPLRIAPLTRFMRTDVFAKLHGVFGMLAHPGAVLGATALRLSDVGVLTVRFMVAASILGVGLGWEEGVLFASSYFLIGMLSPFGMLGAREAGSMGVAAALGFGDAGESVAVVILLVTATESLTYLVAGVAGAVWVRPDRLVRGAKAAATL